jgi:hypothetical protein
MNKRVLLVVILVFIGISTLVWYFFRPTNKVIYTEETPKEPERGSTETITVEQGQVLGDLLLKEQYLAVKNALYDYVNSRYGQSVRVVKLVNSPTVRDDGTVLIKVQTESGQTFDAQINRSQFDTIVFTVPSTGYSKTFKVFGSDSD